MTLDDRLRAALRETARDIPDTPPPLDLSQRRAHEGRTNRDHASRRWISWATPLAAAAVVLAVVAGSLAVTGHLSRHQASPAADYSGVPPCYVALTVKEPYPDVARVDATAAEVRATATGTVLARITVPKPYAFFTAVTAAADDRTFVLVAATAVPAAAASAPAAPTSTRCPGPATGGISLLAKGSMATGKVTTVYQNLKPIGRYQQVMYTNATGSDLVVYYLGLKYGTQVGILHGNQFTPIKWNPHTMTAAW